MIELMDHQQQWANEILGKSEDELAQRGFPLFGESGTGKTYPMALVADRLVREHGGHAIFVVPTRLTWNWRYEFQQMCPHVPEVQLLVMGGSAADRKQQRKYVEIFGGVASLFIFVGYDALRIEQPFFQDMEDITVLALDEAHAIKNRGTQRTRACKSIETRFRFALTGTPITNRPDDLWPVLHFLDPGRPFMRNHPATPPTPGRNCPKGKGWRKYYKKAGCPVCPQWQRGCELAKGGKEAVTIRHRYASPTWGNYEDFTKTYCTKKWDGYRSVVTGGKNMDQLNRRLGRFGMTRWLIDDVLALKPLVFQHVRLEPTGPERLNYQKVSSGIIAMLEDAENGAVSYFERMNPLAILTYLRQCTVLTPTAFAAIRGGLLDEILEGQSELVQGDHSSKEEWLLSHLESTNGAKYLIYCHWIGGCDHLIHTLREKGHTVEGIYGRHNKGFGDVDRLMVRFREDPELKVLVGNESMSEGLNFQAARYVVFFHLPWLPKEVIQFIGRARRIGQERTVISYFLSHRQTIDEDMADTCLSKQSDSDDILDPEFSGRSGMFNVETRRGLINLIRRQR